MHLFSRYLLSSYYVPGIGLGPWLQRKTRHTDLCPPGAASRGKGGLCYQVDKINVRSY